MVDLSSIAQLEIYYRRLQSSLLNVLMEQCSCLDGLTYNHGFLLVYQPSDESSDRSADSRQLHSAQSSGVYLTGLRKRSDEESTRACEDGGLSISKDILVH